MADRREHVDEVVDPALAEGKIVITDQGSTTPRWPTRGPWALPGPDLAQNEVLSVRPDLAVNAPVGQALARLSATPQRARQVSEDPAYLERVPRRDFFNGWAERAAPAPPGCLRPCPGGFRPPVEPGPEIPGGTGPVRSRHPARRGRGTTTAASSLRTAATAETRRVPLSQLFGLRI